MILDPVFLLLLAVALLLDALLGEPDWLWNRVPHPVVAMGRLIDRLETLMNKGAQRRVAGIAALALLLLLTGAVAAIPVLLPNGWIIDVLLGAVLLAHRSLVQHVGAVADGLTQSLAEGRRAVSMIVGRDPKALDQAGVSRAAIESAAENFSDGLVAPAFWFAIAGLPGIAIYKAINTADSMIGYRTERHLEFGWAAARLDDLVNLVPARLTGLLFCLVGGGMRAVKIMRRDAGMHRSPNAGWPEAAMAASLDAALAGPRLYPGMAPVNDPFMHAEGRKDLGPADIRKAVALLWRAWAALVIAALAVAAIAVI
ncbi:MAG: adenosylcobinamide-phosphate synthase CbiB [Pseudomonadota bacterium]